MNKNLVYRLSVLFFLFSASVLKPMQQTNDDEPLSTNALLIFLDDSESDFGAISDTFFTAFIQEAGPIIVSASLINNLRRSINITKNNPQGLLNKFNTLKNKPDLDVEENKMLKSIIVSTIYFDEDIKNKWILKRINPYLYLLLPKKYLREKNISTESTILSLEQSEPITPVELTLGLKINHMETVLPWEIKQPDSKSNVADYFAQYFTDTKKSNPIFVTNKEAIKQKTPFWSIYITGHGALGKTICHLSIKQFLSFLDFLSTIKTRLLVYSSCYAAGINEKLLYHDATSNIVKTYPFTIITDALTDATTRGKPVSLEIIDKKLTFQEKYDYASFVQKITSPDRIHYQDAVEKIIFLKHDIPTTPQIKYPGLEWFSILNKESTVSIGNILAKTRTDPLNIVTFFKNNHPKGILLYAERVPFELIISTTQTFPKIVSMVPGKATHAIKKITSFFPNTIEDILESFYIESLESEKTFIIGSIEAPFPNNLKNFFPAQKPILYKDILTTVYFYTTNFTDVVITLNKGIFTIIFRCNGQLYQATGKTFEPKNITKLDHLSLYSLYKSPLLFLKNNYQHYFSADISQKAAELLQPKEITGNIESVLSEIKTTLSTMPFKSIIRIPKILLEEWSYPYGEEFIRQLLRQRLKEQETLLPIILKDKILWIDQLFQNNKLCFSNIIFDFYSTDQTHVFVQDPSDQRPYKIELKSYFDAMKEKAILKDYVPKYQKIIDYYNEFQRLPESDLTKNIETIPIQDQLTSQRITAIKNVQKRAVKEFEEKNEAKTAAETTKPTKKRLLPSIEIQESRYLKKPAPSY